LGTKPNRQAQQDRRSAKNSSRVQQGNELIASERAINNENYKLDWFKPTEAQQDIIYSMINDDLTLVSGSSGTGKSTTAIWQALRSLKSGEFKKIVFVKTPVESSDDAIGFLSGNAEDKLQAHLEVSRSIFSQFMSAQKLAMEEKNGRIQFKIPNYIQGATLDDTLLIIEESQQISPPILKLLLERVGQNSKCIVLGDKKQCYANKKRQDGFSFFVDLVTDVDDEGRYSKIDTIGYVEIPASENMRSSLSRLIVTLFETTM
jgi:predicted ribonuclease YlaK